MQSVKDVNRLLAQDETDYYQVNTSALSGLDRALVVPAGKQLRIAGGGVVTVDGAGFVVVESADMHVNLYSGVLAYAYEASITAHAGCVVVARGDSHVRAGRDSQVVASASATVRALRDSKVAAIGRSMVTANSGSTVYAYENAYVMSHGADVTAFGQAMVCGLGVAGNPDSLPAWPQERAWFNENPGFGWGPREWCAHWGIPVADDGTVYVYKGVGTDYLAESKLPDGAFPFYGPGATPEAPDWNPSGANCGTGLHFSPHVAGTFEYRSDGRRWMRCPVHIDEIVTLGDKIKAKRVLAPGCVEVDILGQPLG